VKDYFANGQIFRSIRKIAESDCYTFLNICRPILFRMRNVSYKFVYKTTTHILEFFFFLNLAVYEKAWKNFAEWSRPQITIWRMRIACWITLATNTHTQIV